MAEQETTSQFKSDLLELTVHHKPKCIVEFQVAATPQLVKRAHQNAVKEVAKEITLPGFRKGKAPSEIVQKKFPSEIDSKWKETIATASFQEGQKLAKTPLFHPEKKISFDLKSHSLDKGASLILHFETLPQIPTVDPTTIELENPKRSEVNDEKIDETIRQVLMFFAKWTEITDRPVQENDFVLLDVESLEVDPPTKAFSNTRFEVNDKSMAQWMKKLVLGAKKGDTPEGVSAPDATSTEEEKKTFRPIKVRLHILKVEQNELPELNDAFVQRLGAQNLTDFREKIAKILNNKADEHYNEFLRKQVNDELFEKYPFDLPKSAIEDETQFRIKEIFNDPKYKEYWYKMTEPERKKTIESIYQQAEKALCVFYLCNKYLEDNKIEVKPDDVKPAPQNALEALFQEPHKFQNDPEQHQGESFSRLVLKKAEADIASKAKLVEEKKKKVEKPAEEAAKKEAKAEKKPASPEKKKKPATKKEGTSAKKKKASPAKAKKEAAPQKNLAKDS